MFEPKNLFPAVSEAFPEALLVSSMELLDLNTYICDQLSFVRKNFGDKIVCTIKTIEDILISYEHLIPNNTNFFNNLHPRVNPAKNTFRYWKEINDLKKSFYVDCDLLYNDSWCANGAKTFTERFVNYAPWSMDASAHLTMGAMHELMVRPDIEPFLNPMHVCWNETAFSFFSDSESLLEESSLSINKVKKLENIYFNFWDHTQPGTLTEATTRSEGLEKFLEQLRVTTSEHTRKFENWNEIFQKLLQKVSSKFKF